MYKSNWRGGAWGGVQKSYTRTDPKYQYNMLNKTTYLGKASCSYSLVKVVEAIKNGMCTALGHFVLKLI